MCYMIVMVVREKENLLKQLDSFIIELTDLDYVHHKKEFFEVMRRFRLFLRSVDDPDLCEWFLHSKKFDYYKKFFSARNYYYYRALEAIESLSIMTRQDHGHKIFFDLLDTEHIRDQYLKKVEDIRGIDFSLTESMVCVWCGPFPETLFYFYDNTSINKICWIDNNYEAVYIASDLISSLWYDEIDVRYADGKDFDYWDYDVVYVPQFVAIKDDILQQIVATSKDSVQIVLHHEKLLWHLLYENYVREKHPRLQIKSQYDSSTANVTRDTIILQKYPY